MSTAKQEAAKTAKKKAADIARLKAWSAANPEKVKSRWASMTEEQRTAQKARIRAWAIANPERVKKNKKKYLSKHAARLKAARRGQYLVNRKKIIERSRARERRLKDDPDYKQQKFFNHQKRTYGLSRDQWWAMFSAQGGRCGCCGATEPKGKNHWHTDHEHKTGKVRGILCHRCNIMLGYALDDPRILSAGIEYLKAAAK